MGFHKALYSPNELLGININTVINYFTNKSWPSDIDCLMHHIMPFNKVKPQICSFLSLQSTNVRRVAWLSNHWKHLVPCLLRTIDSTVTRDHYPLMCHFLIYFFTVAAIESLTNHLASLFCGNKRFPGAGAGAGAGAWQQLSWEDELPPLFWRLFNIGDFVMVWKFEIIVYLVKEWKRSHCTLVGPNPWCRVLINLVIELSWPLNGFPV